MEDTLAENFPELTKDVKLQIQKALPTPNRANTKKIISRQVSKIKETKNNLPPKKS